MSVAYARAAETRVKLHLRCRCCQTDAFPSVSFRFRDGHRAQQAALAEAVRDLFFSCLVCPGEQASLIGFSPEADDARPDA